MIFQQELRTMKVLFQIFCKMSRWRDVAPRGRCSWIQWLGGQRDRWVRWVTLGLHIFGLHRLPYFWTSMVSEMVPRGSQKWQHGFNIDATWNVSRVQWIWGRSWASLATSWSSIVTAWVGACSCGSASSWRPSASWFACCGWAATSGLSMGNTWEHDGTYTTNLQLRTDWEWSTTNAITSVVSTLIPPDVW